MVNVTINSRVVFWGRDGLFQLTRGDEIGLASFSCQSTHLGEKVW